MKTGRVVRGAREYSVGFTLVEVIVVLAITGMILGVSSLALASLRPAPGSARLRALVEARTQAIRMGQPVHVTGNPLFTASNHSPLPTSLLFLPDGRALGPGVDPLTGIPRDSTP
jgi:prepilin-type N-terminal cleavage/methylation domain-containing protein